MTTLAGGAGLALLLAAAPVHAQLDLLRALLPQSAPFAGGQHMRRHAEEIAAIHREAAQGSPDAALGRAEALLAGERALVASAPRSPFVALLMDTAMTAAGLHERSGNAERARALLQTALDAGAAVPEAVIQRLDLYGRIAALQVKTGAYREAMQTYRTVLGAYDSAPPFMRALRASAYAGLGKAALEAGEDGVAETNLRLAIVHDPAAAPSSPSAPAGQRAATSFAEAEATLRAAFGRAGELAASIAGQRAITDQNGELVGAGGASPSGLLEVQGPLTDLARLYHRRRDAASLRRLYQTEFGAYAARSARAGNGGFGPPALLEQQYARFGAYLAGLGEQALAEEALGQALRLNGQRLAVTARDVPPELLAAPFAARRQLLDLLVSLHLAQGSGAQAWRAPLGELVQSKGLKTEFLGRRARAIGLSTDPEVRRLAGAIEAVEAAQAAGGPDRYGERLGLAQALQARIGKSLAAPDFLDGAVFLERIEQALQGDAYVSVTAFTRFDFAGQRFGARHYLGAALANGKLKVADLGPAAAIDALAAQLRADLSRRPSAPNAGAVPASARAAHDALLKPLLDGPGRKGGHVADLDGAVSLLPFEALASASGRYLIEEGGWRYVSSARALLPEAAPRPAPGRSLVLAAPDYDLEVSGAGRGGASGGRRFGALPQALAEGNAVAGALRAGGAEVALYTGAQASARVLAQARSPRILHIATHGFFAADAESRREQVTGSDGRPYVVESVTAGRSSGLALAGANAGPGEGVLYAAQLRQVDLAGTEVAVLSACDTALGAIRPDEGVDSLRQALEIAGARTMVTSLWSVADAETGALMADFYARLGAGAGTPAALRDAKLRLKLRRPHPFYWAAFVATGMP
jgi:CHAT domain-containing protein/tetratricopeptide (TPR) repeat protein